MEDDSHVSLSNSRSAAAPSKVYALWGGVTAAVVLGLGGIGVAYPTSGTMEALGKINVAKADHATNEAQLLELQKKQANLDKATDSVNKFIAKFPPGADQKQLVDDLSKYASASGVQIVSVNASAPIIVGANGAAVPNNDPAATNPDPNGAPPTPVAPPAEFPLAQVDIDITVNGDYAASTRFVKAVEGGNRSFIIDTLSLSPDGAEGGTTSLKARSFIARKLADPAVKNPATETAPAQTAPAK